MRLLPLRIGVGNQRAGFAQSKAPLPEQALALPDPQMDLEALLDPGAQGFAIPQRAAQPQVARRLAQGPVDLPELRFAQSSWASRTPAFGQPRETLGFKTPYPILDGTRSVAQQAPDFRARRSLGHQEDPMETVIIARFLRTANLVLQAQDHRSSIIDLQWSHADMKPQILIMRNYL
jgi:hypothetical protein